MLDDDMEAQLRAKAEREGERLFTPELQQELARELQEAKRRLPIDEWIALLHQPPPVKPHPEIAAEALRRENIYEDRV